MQRKYCGQINFEEFIDIKKYNTQELVQSTKYQYICGAFHIGSSIYSGHYIAYGKRGNNV